jgi:hypothetical protein
VAFLTQLNVNLHAGIQIFTPGLWKSPQKYAKIIHKRLNPAQAATLDTRDPPRLPTRPLARLLVAAIGLAPSLV